MPPGEPPPGGDDGDATSPLPGTANGNPDAHGDASCDPNKPFGPPSLLVPQPGGLTNVGMLRLSPDSLTAYLTGTPAGSSEASMYMATRPSVDAPFIDAGPIPGAGLGSTDEQDPTVLGSGLMLAFSKGRYLIQRLHYAVRASPSAPFEYEGPMPAVNATVGTDHSPFLREDGQVLYFASTRDTSNNDDIYTSVRTPSSSYGPPSAVNELNSSSNDNFPVVTPNDGTIYFASDRVGPGAQGSLDIYVATRANAEQPFSSPRAVTELNSDGTELPTFVTRDNCTLYFSRFSERDPVSIYVATRSAE